MTLLFRYLCVGALGITAIVHPLELIAASQDADRGAVISQPAAISGTVHDIQGAVLEGARVIAFCGDAVLVTQSDTDGRFDLELPPAPCRLEVQSEGFEIGRIDPVALAVSPIAVVLKPASSYSREVVVFGRTTATVATVPQSVEVLDRDLIASTSSETVGDALRFIPGASRDGSVLDAFGDSYRIRGFEANQTINGISANALRQARDTISIDRIEVLKGPASVLYGQLQPGAVVNVVTRQPERLFSGEAHVAYGRYDDRRAAVDLTGPLTSDGSVRFRLGAAYDDADSWVDFWHREHLFIAPGLAFDLGDATTATIDAFYTRNELEGFVNGLPAEGTVLPNPNGMFSRSLGLTDPTFDPSVRENTYLSSRIEHQFTNGPVWRTAVSWTGEEGDEQGIFGLLGWDEEYRTLSRIVLDTHSSGDTYFARSDLGFSFATGTVAHALVVGADHEWFDRDGGRTVALAPSLDLFAPEYSLDQRPELSEVGSLARTTSESTRSAGLFVQDRLTLSSTLAAVAGLRWSHYEQDSQTVQGAVSTHEQTQTAWTSQLGLLYTPTESLALFTNRTTSFLPIEGITADGSPLRPETGTQYELGARWTRPGGDLAVTAAAFHLSRSDVAVADRENPSSLLAIGEQVAQGIELSTDVRPIPGLSLHAGYTWTDAETTKDTDEALVGKPIRNIPEHGAVLRGQYVIGSGVLAGLSFGGAAVYTGERSGDLENTFELPSFWRTDASLEYVFLERFTVGVSVENLTDEQYFTHAWSVFEVWPGAPRSTRAYVTRRF